MKSFVSLFLFLILGLSSICFVTNTSTPSVSLGDSQFRQLQTKTFSEPFEWKTSSPEDLGLDSSILLEVFREAKRFPFLYSLLVIRNGTLLAERYFNGADKDAAYHIHSASKSFTSALIGIALRENILQSVDQKLFDFFPEYVTSNMDPRKHNITIRHLLTMKAGFNFNDTPAEFQEYETTSDWLQYYLQLPLMFTPGERWHYSTPVTDILSAILTRASNMSTWDFAKQYLFEPSQISVAHWHRDSLGYYTGGRGLFVTPRNMARFGQLYLNNGSLNDEQIIPAAWIEESIQDYSEGGVPRYYGGEFGYGYQWWSETFEGYRTFFAWGHGGQFIINIPTLNMTLVTTASGTIYGLYPNQVVMIRGLISRVLSAVKTFNIVHDGDLIINGSQNYMVTSSMAVKGNVIVEDNATLIVSAGRRLEIMAEYNTQYNFTVRDQGRVLLYTGYLSANKDIVFYMQDNSSLIAISSSALSFANYSLICSEISLTNSLIASYGRGGGRGRAGANVSLMLAVFSLFLSYSNLFVLGEPGSGGNGGAVFSNGTSSLGHPGKNGGGVSLDIRAERFNFTHSNIYACGGGGGGGGGDALGMTAPIGDYSGTGGNGGNSSVNIQSTEANIDHSTIYTCGGGGGGGGRKIGSSSIYYEDGTGGSSSILLNFSSYPTFENFHIIQSLNSSTALGGTGGHGGYGAIYNSSAEHGLSGILLGNSAGGTGGGNQASPSSDGRPGWVPGQGYGGITAPFELVVIMGGLSDVDGDGLPNDEEIQFFFTNPTVADTDTDGLLDGEEITNYGTDPLRTD
ncbi:MAG: serine hydrolase, partial [Candidatus Hodarchaeota archaeon]